MATLSAGLEGGALVSEENDTPRADAPLQILFFPDDARIALKVAAGRADWDIKTTRRFVKKLGLGRCAIGGRRIEVHALAFEIAWHGDIKALQLLREGHRADPRVQRYTQLLGMS